MMLSEEDGRVVLNVCGHACRLQAKHRKVSPDQIEECVASVVKDVVARVGDRRFAGGGLARYAWTTAYHEACHFFQRNCVPSVSLEACAEPPDRRGIDPL